MVYLTMMKKWHLILDSLDSEEAMTSTSQTGNTLNDPTMRGGIVGGTS